jgi:maltose 6'-phosphate phosphatase
MNARLPGKKISLQLFAFMVLVSLLCPLAKQAMAGNEVELRILTINLLFSEVRQRDERLSIIAEFLEENPVDIVLLQEVVGGVLAGTANSAFDLRRKLGCLGLDYELSYRMANGLPGLLAVGNAILSRYPIEFTVAKTLPFESEEIFQGIEVPLKRRVIMSRIKIPDFGPVNVYNTHLCAFCNPSERFAQTEVLVRFILDLERLIPAANPIILGGDFNIPDEGIPSDPSYALITDAGFIDSYGDANGCSNCCSEYGFGCTYAVGDNPYAFNPFTHERGETVRIDYIFLKGDYEIISSDVVFTGPQDWVSDHSAVLTKVVFVKR